VAKTPRKTRPPDPSPAGTPHPRRHRPRAGVAPAENGTSLGRLPRKRSQRRAAQQKSHSPTGCRSRTGRATSFPTANWLTAAPAPAPIPGLGTAGNLRATLASFSRTVRSRLTVPWPPPAAASRRRGPDRISAPRLPLGPIRLRPHPPRPPPARPALPSQDQHPFGLPGGSQSSAFVRIVVRPRAADPAVRCHGPAKEMRPEATTSTSPTAL